MKRDFISLVNLSAEEILDILKVAHKVKKNFKKGKEFTPLKGKTLGMIFHKPSARTRISFEIGMTQLGGHVLLLSEQEIGFGKRESIYDLAKLFSRYMDAVMIRTFSHDAVIELAHHASIPVINGLTDYSHPCQIIADLLTIQEHKKNLQSLKIVYVGDGNNVCNSWFFAAGILGLNFTLACPRKYEISMETFHLAKKMGESTGAVLNIINDPSLAVRDADVIYTDTWTSMGQEKESDIRREKFKKFQVNDDLVSLAKPDVIIMHCLPAHRGEEITDAVMDSERSKVFDQAENRMHGQKAILLWLLCPELFEELL